MELDRINTYFHQFGALNAIKALCADVIRKILDPYNIRSYSQTGEDRIIDSILNEIGFYVEVGCNHPESHSNTFTLYKKGWRGITIDANEELICKHKRLRKRDKSICAVISDTEQEVVFTDFEDSLVSSLNDEHIDEYKKSRTIKNQRVVNTLPLSAVLENCNAPHNFELLSIDVEGHDFEVLSSLDLNIYRPKLIVIEMHKFDLLDPNSSRIYGYLKVNCYKMVGYVVMNGYFLDASAVL